LNDVKGTLMHMYRFAGSVIGHLLLRESGVAKSGPKRVNGGPSAKYSAERCGHCQWVTGTLAECLRDKARSELPRDFMCGDKEISLDRTCPNQCRSTPSQRVAKSHQIRRAHVQNGVVSLSKSKIIIHPTVGEFLILWLKVSL